jgi:hypothetical protein
MADCGTAKVRKLHAEVVVNGIPRLIANTLEIIGFCYLDYSTSQGNGAVWCCRMQGKYHSNRGEAHSNIGVQFYTQEYVMGFGVPCPIHSNT